MNVPNCVFDVEFTDPNSVDCPKGVFVSSSYAEYVSEAIWVVLLELPLTTPVHPAKPELVPVWVNSIVRAVAVPPGFVFAE